MSKILTMLELQQELNDNTNGTGWENGLTAQGKKIDWKRCIYLEAAELVESYPWKHWKNIEASVDRENVKVELVDIWHFVLSEALRVAKLQGVDIKELSAEIEASVDSANAVKIEDDYYQEIEEVEKFIQELFCSFELNKFVVSFINLAKKLGLELDELYKLYIGKNILNKFRQDNGYKDGTYVKIWSGKEDNVVMQEILQKDGITPKELYEELSKEYKKVK